MQRSHRIRTTAVIVLLSAVFARGPAVAGVESLTVIELFEGQVFLHVDGNNRMLAVGETSPEGITLVEADANRAVVLIDGKEEVLHQGTVTNFIEPAFAKTEFSDRSIRGTWVLSIEGFVTAEGTPLFAIGRVIFDGRGGCRSDDQIVVGGVAMPPDPAAQRVASACTYEVQPDGYGVFFVTFENPPGVVDTDGDNASTTTARFIIETRRRISFIADNAELGIFGGGTLVQQSYSIQGTRRGAR